MRLTRKITILVAAGMLLTAMTGVALAADAAAPGDALYGVDLTLEKAGIGSGGVVERLTEASALAENGKSAEALAHAAVAIANAGGDEDGTEEALAGLETAIAELGEELPDDASDNARLVRENVLAMLQWMAGDGAELIGNPDVEPGAFGKEVAGLAGTISPQSDEDDAAADAAERAAEGAEGDGGPPEGVVPGGPPEGVPPSRP